jgi:hypothetical protein
MRQQNVTLAIKWDAPDPREGFVVEIGDTRVEAEIVEAALDRDRVERDDLDVRALVTVGKRCG